MGPRRYRSCARPPRWLTGTGSVGADRYHGRVRRSQPWPRSPLRYQCESVRNGGYATAFSSPKVPGIALCPRALRMSTVRVLRLFTPVVLGSIRRPSPLSGAVSPTGGRYYLHARPNYLTKPNPHWSAVDPVAQDSLSHQSGCLGPPCGHACSSLLS